MQSNDNYITIEMFNNGIQEIKSEIIALNKRIDGLQQEVRINTVKIEATQNSINTGFLTATLAITAVIAIVGFLVTLAPTIRAYFENKLTSSLNERMQEIAEKAINKASAGISR